MRTSFQPPCPRTMCHDHHRRHHIRSVVVAGGPRPLLPRQYLHRCLLRRARRTRRFPRHQPRHIWLRGGVNGPARLRRVHQKMPGLYSKATSGTVWSSRQAQPRPGSGSSARVSPKGIASPRLRALVRCSRTLTQASVTRGAMSSPFAHSPRA